MKVEGNRKTSCTTAGPIMVTEREGRILRVEPMQFDPAEVDSWEVVKNGKTYKPPLTHPVLPWGLIAKQTISAPNRIEYPLKRVDWDPNGQRNSDQRGISGYKRISWDEALDIIESEIRRVIENYGNSALLVAESAHPEWGSLQYFMSGWRRFWDMMGATELESSPISWEGWAAGPTFIWGFWQSFGFPPTPDTLNDTTEHSDLIVLWGTDPLMHNLYSGIDQARLWNWWKDLGKKVVVIDPFCNEMGATVADRWIPILPGTDAAMALAILHVWISENTLDQEFLDTKCLGFDEAHMPEGVPVGLSMRSYVMGEAEDGVAKTPEWAAEICKVPASTIRILAQEWAAVPTSLWIMAGGACRRQYAHEFARLSAVLALAQGVGKPGVNILSPTISLSGPYDNFGQLGPLGYADGGMNSVLESYPRNQFGQLIQLQKFADCIENPPQTWNGGRIFNFNAEEWWAPHEYPAEGCSEVHFYWQRGSSAFNEPDRNRHIRTLRNAKIETFIVSAPWFDRDCRYADLVLPVKLGLECQDITEPANVGQFVPSAYISLRSAVFHQQVLEPQGEARNDIEVLGELARRFGCLDTYLENADEEELLRRMYGRTNIPLSYEEFKEKGYYVWPQPPNYEEHKQLSAFYYLPLGVPVPGPSGRNAMDTPSGKAEIFSTQIYAHYGYNPEIPPVPHYIPEREGAESLELKQKYPLQMTMAHPKYRFHGKYNGCSWLTEYYKVRGSDGYDYEPLWINPADAAARGLVEGDIVRAFNDRGQVLLGVHITDRLVEGVVWLSYGSWNDPMDESERPLDRGGDGNILSNAEPMSIHHPAGGTNSNLLEVEKFDVSELKTKYPQGVAGAYSTWKRQEA